MQRFLIGLSASLAALLASAPFPDAFAQSADGLAAGESLAYARADDVAFILNSLLFLMGGFLVMWMAAGFAMLEAGLVRTKNVSMQCLKNIALYSVAGIMFWLVGYNLMYEGVDGGFAGALSPVILPDPVDDAGEYAVASDWFFQMVFCATTASIVSGTLAERLRFWPFILFTLVLTGLLYPVTGSWQWGGGWLFEAGFEDFAGSTLVHSVGGWAALSGALFLGARTGKYAPNGQVTPLPGSSIPLATLGTFILWLGWFGFNGASRLAMGTVEDASAIARIFANTNIAAAAGVLAVVLLTRLLYRKIDITMVLNGALAGLVSITAEPLAPSLFEAAFVGAVGGVIVVFVVPLLDRLRIDDVVGAIPVHLVAGIWGTAIVPMTNASASYGTQITGILAIGLFTFSASCVVWFLLKLTIGVRVGAEAESLGLDKAEIGVEAYPEFGQGSQRL